MLRNVIAPSRDFTQIANALVWDANLSDAAFRLLVRALALPDSRARSTTVTALAAGMSGGRVTMDRARRQLTKGGLLHCTRWRNDLGHVRTESLVSNVALNAAEAAEFFADHLEDGSGGGNVGGGGGSASGGPDAGRRESGVAAPPDTGTDLPEVVTLVEKNTSPLPVPPPVSSDSPQAAEAERVLRSLRRTDPRLVLGRTEVARLVPLAAEWLARGVETEGLRHALTAGLPQFIKSPAGLVRCRLREKMPEPDPAVPALALVEALVSCAGCERAFRPVTGEQQCGSCRQERSAAAVPAGGGTAGPGPGPGPGWRERIASTLAALPATG
ncbi:hypothetical protein P3T36_001752 [Kitasatospora sp. MAP12-15]|uniref:hypothetical protein n=1 Tax=unclassified Kitasatospora TaxID=2633591 RepID=UPI0024770BD0|nr:hypothetical protein [Kitasatospora sp. MAP12-44]MDH6113368.1 hypothetical protein [Kitasatospora sp. MAP12-44]